jgi:endonuclease YncB( thermonuclease family)
VSRVPEEFAHHPSPFIGGRYRAVCRYIVDADTLDVLADAGFLIFPYLVVRLYGVNAPELNSRDPAERARAQMAKQFVVERVLAQPVIVETAKDTDKYGRYLASVWYWYEGVLHDLSTDLIKAGHAVEYLP